jgi:hypothetical protein
MKPRHKSQSSHKSEKTPLDRPILPKEPSVELPFFRNPDIESELSRFQDQPRRIDCQRRPKERNLESAGRFEYSKSAFISRFVHVIGWKRRTVHERQHP